MATEQKVTRTGLDSEQMCVLTSVYFQISCLYFQISCLTNHSLLQLSCSTPVHQFGYGRLDIYICDYLRKRSLHKCAELFALEAKVPDRQLGKCLVVVRSAVELLQSIYRNILSSFGVTLWRHSDQRSGWVPVRVMGCLLGHICGEIQANCLSGCCQLPGGGGTLTTRMTGHVCHARTAGL